MGITEEGILAEQWLLKKFREKNIHCFQPDAISFENENFILNEIKNQEYYEEPPFNGHGLPIWQINSRLHFHNITNIRCRLIIIEKNTDIIYYQWLDELAKGRFYDTKGNNPRRIYPLYNYFRTTKNNMDLTNLSYKIKSLEVW